MTRGTNPRAFALMLAVLCAGPTFAQVEKKVATKAIQGKSLIQLHAFYQQREVSASPAVKQKLDALRKQLAAKNSDFIVGYTTAMDVPLKTLAGGRPPANIQEIAKKNTMIGLELDKADIAARNAFIKLNPNARIPDIHIACSAGLHTWDYRRAGKVTGVRDQRYCGSCWDFAAVGALESSYLIRNNQTINASEQQILSCANVGGCGGSWYTGVFDYMIAHGAGTEVDYPYVGSGTACKGPVAMPYRAIASGVVHPEVPIPTPTQIKEALCNYGPLAVGVLATDAFQASTADSVLNETVPLTVVSGGQTFYNVNHCVLIVGWDDSKQAWLIKNSWGTGWGSTCGFGTERGYIWIKYGANNVGLSPGWVRAKSNSYASDVVKLKQYYKVFDPHPLIENQIKQKLNPKIK